MAGNDISREDFAVLVARTGLTLTEAQFERMRISYKHIRRLAELVRAPRDRSVEGAHVFIAPRPDPTR